MHSIRNSKALVVILTLLAVLTTGVLVGAQEVGTADIVNADGELIALGILRQLGDQVEVNIQASDLSPGPHGTHIHETGSCQAPDFSSSGGHFGPLDERADENPHGPYAGDLPDMIVDENGNAGFQHLTDLVTLKSGDFSLFDADGSAIVIHELPTDENGNAGARVACGVIKLLGVQVEQPESDPEVVHRGSDFSFGMMELILGLIALAILIGIIMRTM